MRVDLRIVSILLLGASAWAQQPQQIDQPVIDWINTNARPLTTTDPNAALDDLTPLETIVGSAQVVGLGEATHGSRELWTPTGFAEMSAMISQYFIFDNSDLAMI